MKKRILVAEADAHIRSLICDYLAAADLLVVAVEDGQDALNKVELELFDLYLIGLYLPGLDGMELMLRIREIQPLAVVILTTDYSGVEIAAQALHKGAFHYLTKPLELEELEHAVKDGLRQSEESEEVGGISPAALEISKELIDLLLLKGFSPEQQKEFRLLGTLVNYNPNEKIPLNDQLGTMIWVESGRIAVQYSGNYLDTLRPGDLWGEETFIGSNSIFTDLIVQSAANVRHFNRKRLMEFFAYHDESLIKRFMINLIQCIYFKWKKSVTKIGQNPGYSTYVQPSDLG